MTNSSHEQTQQLLNQLMDSPKIKEIEYLMNISNLYGFRLVSKKNVVFGKSNLLLSEFVNSKLDSRIGGGGKTPPPPTV